MSEGEPWAILSMRYGGDVREPSIDCLRRTLREVYHEDISHMTEAPIMPNIQTLGCVTVLMKVPKLPQSSAA